MFFLHLGTFKLPQVYPVSLFISTKLTLIQLISAQSVPSSHKIETTLMDGIYVSPISMKNCFNNHKQPFYTRVVLSHYAKEQFNACKVIIYFELNRPSSFLDNKSRWFLYWYHSSKKTWIKTYMISINYQCLVGPVSKN